MNKKQSLLVIESEPAVLNFLRLGLEIRGWTILAASSGNGGLELAASSKPSIVLLDLDLPDQDALFVLKTLRYWTSVPIIVMSVKDSEERLANCLDAGADDYLMKPFGISELIMRLQFALRRTEKKIPEVPPVYENGGLRIDLFSRRIKLNDEEIHLSPMQYEFIAILVRHAGQLVTRQQIIRVVWGEARKITSEALRIFVYQLRQKMEPDPANPRFLKTEPGIGYRLELPSPVNAVSPQWPPLRVNDF
jgi:two-component system KDP operon response regulator KdpE